MGTLQIDNVPDDRQEALQRRATADGLAVSDYVLTLIERDLAFPSQQQWLNELSTNEPVEAVDVMATLDAVRAARDENLVGR